MITPTVLDRLLEIADLFQRDMAREYDGTPLSSARMRVLWVVHHTGSMTQQALAAALEVTPRNVSALVDALEEAGYLGRSAHPSDRRAVLVDLSDRGLALMRKTTREHEELTTTLLDAVPAADRPALERGIDAIAGRLRDMVAEAETAGAT